MKAGKDPEVQEGLEVSVTVRPLRGDEVSAERVEVKEPGGREGWRGRASGRGRLSGCTNPQQKIKVSPHYYKTQARVEDRWFGMFSEILQLSLPTLAKKKKSLFLL